MLNTTASDIAFVSLGAVTPLIGSVLGVVVLSDSAKTLLLSAIGAATAWGVKALLDFAKETIKERLTKNNKTKESE